MKEGIDLHSIASTCICINCNFTAHIDCTDHYLYVQQPKKDGSVDYFSNLSIEGIERVKKFKGHCDDLMICLSCMKNNEMHLHTTNAAGAPAKGKKPSFEKSATKIIAELRGLAIFGLCHLFTTQSKQRMMKRRNDYCNYSTVMEKR